MGNRAHLKPPNRWKWMKAVEENGNGWTICGCKAHQGTIFSTICISAIPDTAFNKYQHYCATRWHQTFHAKKGSLSWGRGGASISSDEYNPPWDTTKTSQNMSRPCSRRMSLHTRSLTFHYTWWCSTCRIWRRPRLCPRASTHCSHRNHPQSRRFGFDARLLPAPIVHQSKGTVLSWHGLMFRSCSAYYSYLRPGASTAPLPSQ